MLSCKSLLICLPLLAVAGCGGKSSKKSNPTPPQTTDAAPSVSGTDPVSGKPVEGSTSAESPAGLTAGTVTTGGMPTGGATEEPVGIVPGSSEKPAGEAQAGKPADKPEEKPVVGPECDEVVIDFEKTPEGAVLGQGAMILEQYAKLGIHFKSSKNEPGKTVSQAPILFDSLFRPDGNEIDKFRDASKRLAGDMDGFDWDLTTTNHGKLLIIAENMADETEDNIDNVTYPDDNNFGGVIKVTFDKPTKVLSMDFVDLQDGGNAIETFVKNGESYSRIARQSIDNGTNDANNNIISTISVDNADYADRLEINLITGGGLDNLKLCIKK